MEKKIRLRAPNFTSGEISLLCDIISKYKHVIENKKNDGANLIQKQKAWLEIMEEFNAITTDYHRTVESLQQNYKNLKKKVKKSASNAKMDIPVDSATLVENIEEYGTSSEGWDKVAESTGASKEKCQKLFDILSKEAKAKDKGLKKDIMGTGKRKLETQILEKQTVSEKFKALASEKMECTGMQKEILKLQLVEEQEKLEHNRLLRKMELNDAKAKYEHNIKLRKLEIEKFQVN